jgi:hypothetical protein
LRVGDDRGQTATAGAPSQREIAERAYALWIHRGRLDGGAFENWMDAERQLVAEREGTIPANATRERRPGQASRPVRSRAGLVSGRRRVARRRVVEPDLASK